MIRDPLSFVVTASDEALQKLQSGGQIAFAYSGKNGAPPAYPEDPNGSQAHIAGICDPSGRILGMMPHPERFVRRYQHPAWTRHTDRGEDGDGLALFKNAVEYAAS